MFNFNRKEIKFKINDTNWTLQSELSLYRHSNSDSLEFELSTIWFRTLNRLSLVSRLIWALSLLWDFHTNYTTWSAIAIANPSSKSLLLGVVHIWRHTSRGRGFKLFWHFVYFKDCHLQGCIFYHLLHLLQQNLIHFCMVHIYGPQLSIFN